MVQYGTDFRKPHVVRLEIVDGQFVWSDPPPALEDYDEAMTGGAPDRSYLGI